MNSVFFSIDNPPPIKFIKNSRGNQTIVCLNYKFSQKKIGKEAANFKCRQANDKCKASVSFETEAIHDENYSLVCDENGLLTYQIKMPPKFKHLQLNHHINCKKFDDTDLIQHELMIKTVEKIKENPTQPLQQLYERIQVDFLSSGITLKEYSEVKSSLNYARSKLTEKLAHDIDQVKVNNPLNNRG